MSAGDRDDSIIGIMADSHGDADSIYLACRLFRERGCGRICHLGDICDSLRPETADACIRALKSETVVAIRGNNDHSLLMNQRGRTDGIISEQSRLFLEHLPLKVSFAYADLVHSLPLTEELGFASMIGSMGLVDGPRLFRTLKQPVLFRGHSHSPEVAWRQNGQTLTRKLHPAERLDLAALMPCIVTCGALTDGYCLIWEPSRRTVTCLRLALGQIGC